MTNLKFGDVGLLTSGGLTGLFSVLLSVDGGLIITALSTGVFVFIKWREHKLDQELKREKHKLEQERIMKEHELKLKLLEQKIISNDNSNDE